MAANVSSVIMMCPISKMLIKTPNSIWHLSFSLSKPGPALAYRVPGERGPLSPDTRCSFRACGEKAGAVRSDRGSSATLSDPCLHQRLRLLPEGGQHAAWPSQPWLEASPSSSCPSGLGTWMLGGTEVSPTCRGLSAAQSGPAQVHHQLTRSSSAS